MKLFKGMVNMEAVEIRSPRGSVITCKGWVQEAALRMLMNNLDPDVAESPADLVVYGGTGKACRNWDAYHSLIRELRLLSNTETLLVQSGKPVAVLPSHKDAPRVLIANSNLVGKWANWEKDGKNCYYKSINDRSRGWFAEWYHSKIKCGGPCKERSIMAGYVIAAIAGVAALAIFRIFVKRKCMNLATLGKFIPNSNSKKADIDSKAGKRIDENIATYRIMDKDRRGIEPTCAANLALAGTSSTPLEKYFEKNPQEKTRLEDVVRAYKSMLDVVILKPVN